MPARIARTDLDIIIERIAHDKMSVVAACDGICDARTFFRYLTEDTALGQQYTRARESRADARFEALDELLAEMRAGKLDPAAARVMVDTIKWQCGRERPKRYGVEYRAVELSGPEGGPIETRNVESAKQALEDRLAGIAGRIAPPVKNINTE